MRGAPSDRHRNSWDDRPGTILHTKTEVPSGGEMDMEGLEIRDNYLGTGGLHTRDDKNRFIQCGN